MCIPGPACRAVRDIAGGMTATARPALAAIDGEACVPASRPAAS